MPGSHAVADTFSSVNGELVIGQPTIGSRFVSRFRFQRLEWTETKELQVIRILESRNEELSSSAFSAAWSK